MKSLFRFTLGLVLLAAVVFPAGAGFSSLYIFGDGLSTTTNNPIAGAYYYGLRRSNGRVWVEVLAQRLGLGANSITNVNWSNSSNNWSYYGQYSSVLAANLGSFPVPPDAGTALFIVWVNNADFVGDVQSFGNLGNTDHGTNIVAWTNAINQSLASHWQVITNLYYAAGARTLLMPNAVDLTEAPQYNISPGPYKSFVRQRVIDFNTAFASLLNQARTALPGLVIYEPDYFKLLDNVLTNAAAYGLTNVLSGGNSIDVVEDGSLANKALNGPGTNYIFWDASDPTAKMHEVLADIAVQMISPVTVDHVAAFSGSNRLDVVNVPVGLNGFVQVSTNLATTNWTAGPGFTSTNVSQSVFVPASGPQQFYRLRFPFAWSWP